MGEKYAIYRQYGPYYYYDTILNGITVCHSNVKVDENVYLMFCQGTGLLLKCLVLRLCDRKILYCQNFSEQEVAEIIEDVNVELARIGEM